MTEDEIRGLLTPRMPILPALQVLQEALGFVPESAIDIVADVCNVSRAEVFGVFTFYPDLSSTPTPKVRLCAAEACQAVGGRELASAVADAGIESAPVYCLGLCSVGPAALVAEAPIARADVARIAAALS